MELKSKNKDNSTVYTAFNEVKQNSFLEQRLAAALMHKMNAMKILEEMSTDKFDDDAKIPEKQLKE